MSAAESLTSFSRFASVRQSFLFILVSNMQQHMPIKEYNKSYANPLVCVFENSPHYRVVNSFRLNLTRSTSAESGV